MFLLPENAQQIVDEIKTTVNYNLNIMDENGVIIASTDKSRVGSLHIIARDLIKSGDSSYIVYEDDDAKGCKRGINLPIMINKECVGVVGLTGDPNEVSSLGAVIQKMTEIMLIEIQQQLTLSDLESSKFNFIERLIFGETADERSIRITANSLHFNLDSPKILCLFGPVDDAIGITSSNNSSKGEISILSLIRTYIPNNVVCVPVNENILVIFESDDTDYIHHLCTNICHNIKPICKSDIYCGISQVAFEYTELPYKFKQALSANHTASMFGSSNTLTFNEQSLAFIIQSIPDFILSSLTERTFSSCSESERQELLETLSTYFKTDGNSNLAAKELFIHPNSFLYRLNKVKSITGLDPRKPSNCGLLSLIVAYHNIHIHD